MYEVYLMKPGMVKLTGLWASTDKNGNMYLSGNLSGTTQIKIFQNTYKTNSESKDPDYFVYVTQKEFDANKSGESR